MRQLNSALATLHPGRRSRAARPEHARSSEARRNRPAARLFSHIHRACPGHVHGPNLSLQARHCFHARSPTRRGRLARPPARRTASSALPTVVRLDTQRRLGSAASSRLAVARIQCCLSFASCGGPSAMCTRCVWSTPSCASRYSALHSRARQLGPRLVMRQGCRGSAYSRRKRSYVSVAPSTTGSGRKPAGRLGPGPAWDAASCRRRDAAARKVADMYPRYGLDNDVAVVAASRAGRCCSSCRTG